jgi:hypothetical protein
MSMVERSAGISVEGTMKSFNKFIPPPWESIKESTSGSLRILLEVGSQSILLKILGVSGTRFFPSITTRIVLLF